MHDLPYRWCFFHNVIECDHSHDDKVDIQPHCMEIDELEDYSKCDVREAFVVPKTTEENTCQ